MLLWLLFNGYSNEIQIVLKKKSKYIFNIFSLPAFWISKQCLNEYGLQPPESVQLL